MRKSEYPEENSYIEIDLIEIIKMLWKRALLIIIVALICGALTLGLTFALQPKQYDASIMVYVNNASVSLSKGLKLNVSGDQLTAAQKLADTYIVILNSTTTLEEIIDQADLNISPGQLAQMISSSTVNDTEVFQVTVRSREPEKAALIANTILKVLPKRISGIVSGSDIATVDYARVPTALASPNYLKNTAIGVLLGFILACLFIIVANILDKKILSTDWMTQHYPNVPLLAIIPDINEKSINDDAYYLKAPASKEAGYGASQLRFSALEAYKMLRTNVFMSFSEPGGKVIGISSSEPGEGKSLTVLNLATSIAEVGKKTCLVEADLRLPSLVNRIGNAKREKGLTEAITGDGASGFLGGLKSDGASEFLSGIEQVIEKNCFKGVDIVFSGKIPPNPAELLGSEKMKTVIADLKAAYDYVILDLPPLNEVSDPIVVSPLLSGMILVVRHEMANEPGVNEAFRKLKLTDTKILGYVYNGNTSSVAKYKKYKEIRRYDYRQNVKNETEKNNTGFDTNTHYKILEKSKKEL